MYTMSERTIFLFTVHACQDRIAVEGTCVGYLTL